MATALFLLDAAMDAAMLGIAARLAGGRIKAFRLLLGALAGAGMAALVRRLALSGGQTAALWLPMALMMQLLAQGRNALAHPVRHVFLLLCAAGLLGGTLTALHGATGSLTSAYAMGGAMMTAMTASLLRARRASAGVQRGEMLCRRRGRAARIEAIIDSGNTLRDYLTHRPVIVLPQERGRRLFGLENEALRPIFADTAGGRQMMEIFVPQETVLFFGGKRRRVLAAVALCSGLGGGAPALVPASLLEEAPQGAAKESVKESNL